MTIKDTPYQRASIQSLQALRAVAAIGVVLYHASIVTYPAFFAVRAGANEDLRDLPIPALHMGYAGVEIFFVLSGFLMYYVHAQDFGKPSRIWNFLTKRFKRIFPFYWIVLTVVLIRYYQNGELPPTDRILESALLLPVADQPIIREAWSLKFEIIFYLMFLSFLLDRRLGLFLAAIWLASIMIFWLTGYTGWGSNLLFSTYPALFFMGILTAMYMIRLPADLASAGFWIGAGSYLFVGISEAYGLLVMEHATRTLVYGIGASMIIGALASHGLRGTWNAPRSLVFLGDASYSIYLVHHIFLAIGGRLSVNFGLDQIIAMPLLILGISTVGVVGGVGVYMAVERPLLNLMRGRRRSGSPARI